MIRVTKITTTFITLVFLVAAIAASAETTPLVNYQGKLTKNGKNENGQINITFKIYTGETNNESVYEESQQIAVVDGFYSTLIGQNPTFGTIEEACKLNNAYLEITINNKTLTPREQFCPPAFAQKATERWNLFYSNALASPDSGYGAPPFGPNGRIQIVTNTTPSDMVCILFPIPTEKVTVESAKLLIRRLDNNFQLISNPPENIVVYTGTVSLTRSYRQLGAPYPISLTNLPTNSWITLPLTTNNIDRTVNTNEMLYICIYRTGDNNGICSADVMADIRVK